MGGDGRVQRRKLTLKQNKRGHRNAGRGLIDVDSIQLASLLDPMNVKKARNEGTQHV